MKKSILAALAVAALASPAFASGNVAHGKQLFNRCKACHSIVAPDGNVIVHGGKIGPNLYGIIGSKAGSVPGFKFSEGLKEAGQKGLVWTQAKLAEWVKNPTKFLEKDENEPNAHSKMMFMLPQGGADVAAYLASVAPASK